MARGAGALYGPNDAPPLLEMMLVFLMAAHEERAQGGQDLGEAGSQCVI